MADSRDFPHEDNDSDIDITEYHRLMSENYLDEEKLQDFSKDSNSLKQSVGEGQVKKIDGKFSEIGKSVCSTKTFKTFHTSLTGKTFQSKYASSGIYTENTSNKRRFMKQESRRIKNELRY